MAYIATACVVMAYIAMAYVAMAYIAIVYVAMAYMCMAIIVMAYAGQLEVRAAAHVQRRAFRPIAPRRHRRPTPELWPMAFVCAHAESVCSARCRAARGLYSYGMHSYGLYSYS